MSGTIDTAYNGSGTYATVRVESKDKIKIVLPQDFPTTIIRTAMVSSKTAHSE